MNCCVFWYYIYSKHIYIYSLYIDLNVCILVYHKWLSDQYFKGCLIVVEVFLKLNIKMCVKKLN